MEITSTLKGIDGDYNQKKSSHIFDTQNSQENTFARVSFLIKLQDVTFLQNTFGQLLLQIASFKRFLSIKSSCVCIIKVL